jgi:hypothetical protein
VGDERQRQKAFTSDSIGVFTTSNKNMQTSFSLYMLRSTSIKKCLIDTLPASQVPPMSGLDRSDDLSVAALVLEST